MITLKSDLTRIAAKSPKAASAALLQTAADIVKLTKAITPVDTGALKQSYGAAPIDSHTIEIGSDMIYAPFVEFGTVNSPAQPHFVRSFLQSQITFKTRLTQELKKIINA